MPNSLDPRSPSLHALPERTALAFGLGLFLQPLARILGTLPGQRAAHLQPSCQGDSGHGALPGWSRVLVPSLGRV